MSQQRITSFGIELENAAAGCAQPSSRWTLASLSLSMLLSSLGTSSANVALPTLSKALAAGFREVQWVVIAYLLSITTLIVSVGRLGDLTGRRRLLLGGIFLFSSASALSGLAPTLWLLIAARAAQGLGAAVMMSLSMAFIGETVPKAKIGSAMGLLGTMSAIGTALGPSLGGILIAGFGWRAIFLVNVPLGLLGFSLAYRFLPMDRRDPTSTRVGFDKIGTLLLALTLGAYSLAVTVGRGSFGPSNIALLLAAAVGVGLFVLAERNAASPLIQFAIFRDPTLSAGLAMSALVSTVMMATLVVGPFYLSRALGLDAAMVGLVLSVGPISSALIGVPSGRIADRFGARRVTIVGLIGIAVGCVDLSFTRASLGIPGYIAPIVVMTAAYALFQTANNSSVMRDVRPDRRGVISGVLNLSRNLGLITGASVMGTVFAVASATVDAANASRENVATGMRTTFAVAAVLIVIALIIALGSWIRSRHSVVGKLLFVIGIAIGASGSAAQAEEPKVPGHRAAGSEGFALATYPEGASLRPFEPYPLNAAGWGPEAGNGLFYSRWAEDWTVMRIAGKEQPLKSLSLGGDASLTLSAEVRLRYNTFENGQLILGNDYQQSLLRSILGADLRLNSNLRIFGEIGTGQVEGRRNAAPANFQNDGSLQQLFVDARGSIGSTLVGAMVGRQEFSDGPRQLISLSDGPNLHRTWNGVRLYAHGQRWRVGAFDLRATRMAGGLFDEEIDDVERLRGLNASLIVSPGPKDSNIYLDPFWIRTENAATRSDGGTNREERDTYGARLWGRRGGLRFDWTLARQTGEDIGHGIDAWGLFAVQSIALSEKGWKPRLTAHIDLASGGNNAPGSHKGFHQLYASSSYLGEARFLSLSNLLLVAPGISVSPTPTTNFSIEYGFARRLVENDAVYAGGMRPYSGTQNVPGREIGGLLRVAASWSVTEHLTLSLDYEHLSAGDVLKNGHFPSGSHGYIGATFMF